MNQRDVAGDVLRFLTSGEQFIEWNFVTRCESLSHLPESTFWAGLLVRQLLYDLHQFLHKMPGDVLARGIFQIAYDALGTNRDLRKNKSLS